jgi:hypothetical protein
MTTKATISKAPSTRATSRTAATERGSALLVLAIALGLAIVSSAAASDVTLGATLSKWSRTIAADARSVSTAAKGRHPRRMTTNAARFRKDALRAHAVIAAERSSSLTGGRAKALALRAFANYAMAGKRWAASGHARLAHRRARASALAHSAGAFARRGNRLLVMAGTLLP